MNIASTECQLPMPEYLRGTPEGWWIYWSSLVLAVALHAILLFGWRHAFLTPASYSVDHEDNTVDVTLMNASAPEPPAAIPQPEPLPVPTPAAMFLPSTSPAPAPKATPAPQDKASVSPLHPPAHRVASARTGTAAALVGHAANGNLKPSYLRNPAPEYPSLSRQNHEEGVVLLAVAVDEQGRVSSLRLMRGSGYPRLDAAARNAVRQWQFNPARAGGIAISSEIEVPVRFKLQ